MENLTSVFLFAALIMCAQAATNVGDCTLKEYTQKERSCTTLFIHGLQKQPKISCRPKLEDFFNCTVKVVKRCIKTLDEAAIRASLEQKISENTMCELAGVSFPVPVGPNQTFPCTVSKAEYGNQTESCNGDVKHMWHNNRNDQRLCSKYTEMKKCVQKIMTANCNLTGDFKERADISFDSYNPFCADPKSKSTNVQSLSLFIMLIFSVLITGMWF